LFKYIFTAFLVRSEVGLKKIREKEELQNEKHDKKLYEDDNPNPVAPP
jgi:hypothetical protein